MFRRIEDVCSVLQAEGKLTLTVLESIPDTAMHQAVHPEHRDLTRMAWHLVETLIEMPGRLGLTIEGASLLQSGHMAEPPVTMTAIRETYARCSASLLKALADWSDSDLEREDDMYGDTWKRGFSLWVLVTHQVHHRGQMTVLMRQAGLKVPDIYGPAKEGWAAYGMEAPRV